MSTNTDREKILTKIQKCLRLSKSSEPHEAAAAMRQAQKLMQQYQVTDSELLGLEVKSVLVITPAPAMRKCPLGFAHLVSIIQTAFGVNAVMEHAYVSGKPRLAFRYFGIGGRPELAAYAHDVIWRQMWGAWNKYRKDFPELANVRGARMGFWVGWLQRVRQQVIDFGATPEEKELVKRQQLAYYGGALASGKQNKMAISGRTMAAGHEAAGDFSLHRPMNGKGRETLALTND